jgi:hypothetical protein
MAYGKPADNPNDDGITFDGAGGGLVLHSEWHGTPSTMDQTNIELYQLDLDKTIHDAVAQANTTQDLPTISVGGIGSAQAQTSVPPYYDIQVAVQQAVLKSKLQGKALWYDLALRPISNGPFSTYYVISTSPVSILQGVDLSAPSSLS